jgi:trigger factor
MANPRGKKAAAKKAAAKKSRVREPRPPIPPKIKLQVRQRCGFGCVVCGAPVYQYDHIKDYAKEKKHEAENITLLCPSDHQDKTNKLLPLSKVHEANANPANKQTGQSAPRKYHYAGNDKPTIVLGDVGFNDPERDFAAIMIDGVPMVGFRFVHGRALLQLNLFDAENNLVLQVVDNELIYSVDIWDVEFKGSVLTIRQKERHILLRIRFDPENNMVEIDRGMLQYNGAEVEIWPDCLVVLNSNAILSAFTLQSPIGLLIGKRPPHLKYIGQLLNLENIPREFDRAAVRKKVTEERKRISAFRAEQAAAEAGADEPQADAGEG